MPILKEYAESNDKDGYYVHAPISGRDHPLPLQTPVVTEKIYREIGYEPTEPGHDGGVHVPNELAWTLYNVGLHWTKSSGPQGDPSELDPDRLRDETGPELTDDDIDTILSFTEEYKGQYQSRVKDLREELGEESGGDSGASGGSGGVITVEELLGQTSDEPPFADDVEKKLESWEPQSVVDDDHEPDHKIGELLSTPRSEYREALASVPNLENLLQIYADHPWEVSTVRAVGSSPGDTNGLKVSFNTDDIPDINGWAASDYRYTEDERDFKISVSIGSRDLRFEIVDNYISDFHIGIGQDSVGKFDLPPDDYWGYEVHNQNPNEIMHTLIVTISDLVPRLVDFFEEIPDYSMESTDMTDHSIYLP